MQRTIESLERIIALGEKLLTTFDIEGLLTQIVSHVKDLLQADGATLYLVDPVEKLMISQVILSDRVEEIVLPVGNDSIAGYTALHRRSLNIPDAYGDLSNYHPTMKFNREIDEKFHTHTKSILTHPLVLRDELIGVFQVVNKKDGIPFDDDDLRILRNFSVIAGIAILNARLVERVVEEQANANDIIEHISEKVIIQNLAGEVLSLNHRAAEDLPPGVSPREAKGRKVVDLFPSLSGLSGEIRKVIDHNLDKTFSGGKMPYVILTAKNARQMIEKIILIIKEPSSNHHPPGPPPATPDDPA